MQLVPECKGTIVGLALGTAIVPFMDLVAYLMRLNVFNQSVKKGQNVKIFGDERFDWCTDPSFKFVLFVSVRTLDEGIGLELCKKLDEFNSQNNYQNFQLHLRVSSGGEKRWDREYFSSRINASQVARAYIASVAGVEASFSKLLEEVGIQKKLINIL